MVTDLGQGIAAQPDAALLAVELAALLAALLAATLVEEVEVVLLRMALPVLPQSMHVIRAALALSTVMEFVLHRCQVATELATCLGQTDAIREP